MTSPAVDVAYVDVVARTKEFRKDLKNIIDNEVAELNTKIDDVFNEIDAHFAKTAREAHRTFSAVKEGVADVTGEVGGLTDAVEELGDRVVDVGDDFDDHFNRAFRRFTDAWDDFDRRGAGRAHAALEQLRSGLGNVIDGAQKAAGAVGGGLLNAFAALPAFAVPLLIGLPLIVGLLSSLGAVAVDAAGALALLPGAIALLPAIIAPLVIGFNGFGEALGAVLSKDPERLVEALKPLAPAARAVVLEFQGLLPIFTQIGDVVQQQLFAPLVGDLTRFISVVRGPLLAGLATVATALGNIISDVAGLLSSPAGVEAFAALFASTSQILETMRPAIVTVLAGFRDLVVASLPFLEKFATFISQVGVDFGTWLSEFAKSEDFKAFMDSALSSLKSIADLIPALLGFFGALFSPESVAGGQAILTLLTDVLGVMTEFLKSEAGKRFLEDLALLAVGAAGAISALVLALGFVFASITLFVGEVTRLFTGLDELLDGWSERTKNTADNVVGFISAVPERIGAFAAQFADAGFNLITSFIGGFRRVGNFIGDVAGDIVGHIKSGLNSLIARINLGIAQLDAALPFSLGRIPQLGDGAVVSARSGGTLANIAEAGEDEVVAPLSTLEDMITSAASSGGPSVTFDPGAIVINFNGAVPSESDARVIGRVVGQEISGSLAQRGVNVKIRAR